MAIDAVAVFYAISQYRVDGYRVWACHDEKYRELRAVKSMLIRSGRRGKRGVYKNLDKVIYLGIDRWAYDYVHISLRCIGRRYGRTSYK